MSNKQLTVGIIATLLFSVVAMGVAISKKTVTLSDPQLNEVASVIQRQLGSLDKSTGFNSIDFQGLGDRSDFGVAKCRIPTGARVTATSSCAVQNTTGRTLYAWINSTTASSTETSSLGGTPNVSGIASSTVIFEAGTSTTALPTGWDQYADVAGGLVDNYRIATGTRSSISSLTATSTNANSSQNGLVEWRPNDYIWFVLRENTVATNRCAGGTVGTDCEQATSTNRGFHMQNFIYYHAADNER